MSSSNGSKKKQEEKHLKTLREFLALPANKTCFDCNQRGPTYVNATIGSFVCISCSGKLRGLTPPHRVKSISMASFTPEEIEFLRSRGNEYCRLVWMGHYNMADLVAETKDEQKFKDHLVAKYEKKRWYTDPGTIVDRLSAAKMNGTSHIEAAQQEIVVPKHSPVARPAVSTSKSSDLLADLDFFVSPSKAAFASPIKVQSTLPQSISQPSFANFQNADFFFPETSPQKSNAASTLFGVTPQVQLAAVNGFTSPPKATTTNGVVPPEDRYSALKDLDALFTTAEAPAAVVTAASASPAWSPAWNPGPLPSKSETAFSNSMEAPSAWNTVFESPSSSNPSNPFLAATPQTVNYGRPALPWANFAPSTSNAPLGNGFPPAPSSGGNHFALGFNASTTTLTSSQSLDLSPKIWGTSPGMNPFMDTASFTQSRSHNPFL